MSKEPNNIDRLVREKLDGFEMTPPPSVWKKTSASLNPRRKRRFILWFILGLASITIAGMIIYFLSDRDETQEQLITSTASNERIEENSEKNTTTSSNNTSSFNQNESNDKVQNASSNSSGNNSNPNGQNEGTNSLTDSNSATNSSKSNGKETSRGKEQKSGSTTGSGSSTKSSSASTLGSSGPSGDQNRPSETSGSKTGRTPSDDDDDLTQDGENGRKEALTNDATSTSESISNEQIGLLPTRPAELLELDEASIEENTSSKPNQPSLPIWKMFSLEGSVGVSTFSNNPTKNSAQTYLIDALKDASSQRTSLNLNFGLNYHFNSRMSLQTGIEYSRSNEDYTLYTTEYDTFQYFDSIATGFDSTSGDSIYLVTTITDSTEVSVPNTLQNTYTTLTIPFQFGWTQAIGVRSRLEFALGGDLTIYGRNDGIALQDSSNTVPLQDAYKTSGVLSLGGSIRYLYYFGSRHAVYIQPWARFGITNQGTPVLNYESLRRRYGIRVGYRFHL